MEQLDQRAAFIARETMWSQEAVSRLLSRFPRLSDAQAIAAIRAAVAYAAEDRELKRHGDDFAWLYAYQLAAFVSR